MSRAAPTPGRSQGLFDPRHARWLLIAGGLSVAVTLIGMLFLEPPEDVVTSDTNSFSTSAIGHQAVTQFLRDAGLGVQVSRYDSLSRASSDKSALWLIEPQYGALEATLGLWSAAIDREVPVLLVLPKWRGLPQPEEPRWLQRLELRGTFELEAQVQQLLDLDEVEMEGLLLRPSVTSGPWESPWPGLDLELPQPQLLRLPKQFLLPVVSTHEGVLLGRVPGVEAYVLSDPDLLNTRGLGKADNALLTYRLARHVGAAGALVVDETLHGFDYHPSLVRELLSYPLVLVFGHILVLLIALLWAASQRFGRALPPPPRLVPGKETLIENTAELLHGGAHTAYGLRRYLQLTVRLVASACSLPEDLKPEARLERLAAIGRGRGVRSDVRHLAERVDQLSPRGLDARRALRLGQAIHRWRKEMTDGIA